MIPALLLNPRGLMVAGAAAAFLALGAWGFSMKAQRDSARVARDRAVLDLEHERLVVRGMRMAQDVRLAEAQVKAQAIGQKTAALLAKLDASLPQTDEEARAWALAVRP